MDRDVNDTDLFDDNYLKILLDYLNNICKLKVSKIELSKTRCTATELNMDICLNGQWFPLVMKRSVKDGVFWDLGNKILVEFYDLMIRTNVPFEQYVISNHYDYVMNQIMLITKNKKWKA